MALDAGIPPAQGREGHMLQSSKAPATTGEWECMECGHIEEGIELERPARCPECNAGTDAFEFFALEDEEWEGDVEDDDDEEDEDLVDESLADEDGDDFEDLDDEDLEDEDDFEDDDDFAAELSDDR
jgi:hypothetical protein